MRGNPRIVIRRARWIGGRRYAAPAAWSRGRHRGRRREVGGSGFLGESVRALMTMVSVMVSLVVEVMMAAVSRCSRYFWHATSPPFDRGPVRDDRDDRRCDVTDAGRSCLTARLNGGGITGGRRSRSGTCWLYLGCLAVIGFTIIVMGSNWMGDAGAERYGEASHPGRVSGMKQLYADPRRETFRGACFTDTATSASQRQGTAEQRAPAQEHWALRVVSANTSGWGPLQRLMLDTEADVVLAQEHKLGIGDIAAASDWAIRRGWKSMWAEATETCEGGRSGGVVVLARSHLGLAPPPWGDHVITKARAVAATLEAPACRPTVLVSAYLIDGIGPGAANRKILADVGRKLQSLGHAADGDNGRHLGPMPCLIAGDFNMVPEQLAETGFADNINATIIAPRTARGTCRAANSGRTLDYFLATSGLDQGVDKVTAGDNRIIKTHVPVMVTFKPRLTTLRALALRTPPRLPIDRVYGPIPPPPNWSTTRAATTRAREAAKRRPPEEAQEVLDMAYAEWASRAEEELQDVTGKQLPKAGCRAEGPKLVWRTIIPEKTHRGQRSRAADEWRAMVARVRDMTIVAGAARKGQFDQASAIADELWGNGIAAQRTPGTREACRGLQADEEGGREARAIVERLASVLKEKMRRRSEGGQGDWGDWDHLAESAAEKVKEQLQRAEREERSEATEAWKEWVTEGAASGAMHAHKAVKLPQQWVPTTTTHDATGALTADPLQLLASQRRDYAKQWAARDNGQRRWYSHTRKALPRLGPSEVRAAAKSVRRDSAQTHDGFHPRHLSLLSDGALEALADIYEAAEALGSWPSQLSLITMPALPKPDGGYRLIGIFTAAYRVWARARRPLADQWESTHDRPYFAAGAHRSPVDAVWRQSLRAEAAMSEEGWTAAAVLTDLDKFYEHIEHDELLERAARLGFPEPLARLALAAYGGPRMIRLKDFVAEEVYADRGVVAGCSLATTLTKVYTLEAYDHLVEQCPEAQFDNYIDDNVISAEGGKDRVVEVLTRATNLLNDLVTGDLHCKISRRKTRIIAAHNDVGARLRNMTERAVGGTLAPSAPNLGTDYAAGKCKRRHGRARKAAARLKQGLRRKGRLRRVAAAVGGSGLKLFTTGTMASMIYGAEVHGISDAEWKRIDRLAAVTLKPKARGRSLDTLMALHKAPTWRAGTAPVQQYVRAIWRAANASTGRRTADLTLPEIRRAWEAMDKEALRARDPGGGRKRRWDRVRGPMGANLLSLDRIDWHMTDPFTIVDDVGVTRNILDHSPAMWGDFLRAAVTRRYERQAAAVLARRDGNFQGRRVCLDHIRALLIPPAGKKPRARMDPLGYGVARAMVCNAIWTHGRANDIDDSITATCPLCGKGRDTVHHRLWWCEKCNDLRSQMVPERLVARARREGEGNKFFTTGIIPHPAEDRPGPAAAPMITIERHDGGSTEGMLDFQGHFFVDGSCTTHEIPELRRAGWAVVVTNPVGELIATIRSPLWKDLPQTPQAAEFVAYAAAVQYMAGPSTVFGDCANVIKQATASPSARIAPMKRYSGVMRDLLKYPHRIAHQEAFVKVKAHMDIHSIQEEEGRRLAVGNDLADRLAKGAVKDHPAPSPAEESMLAVDLADAKLIIKFAAAALRRWPALDKKMGRTRMPGGRRRQVRKEEDRHDWTFVEGAWKCSKCLKCAFGSSDNPGESRGRCTGIGTDARAEEARAQGHAVAIMESDGLPVICCTRCGAWTARRKRGTAQPCKGRPTKAGAQALYNIRRGKHPWLPPNTRDYQRAALGGRYGKGRNGGNGTARRRGATEMRAGPSQCNRADVEDITMTETMAEDTVLAPAPPAEPAQRETGEDWSDHDVRADACDLDDVMDQEPHEQAAASGGGKAIDEDDRGTLAERACGVGDDQPCERKRRKISEGPGGGAAAAGTEPDRGHRESRGLARQRALMLDQPGRFPLRRRRDEHDQDQGSGEGQADKRRRLDAAHRPPSPPARHLRQRGGESEGEHGPVGVSHHSVGKRAAIVSSVDSSCSDPTVADGGPLGGNTRAPPRRARERALPPRPHQHPAEPASGASGSAAAAFAGSDGSATAASCGQPSGAVIASGDGGSRDHGLGDSIRKKRQAELAAHAEARRAAARRRIGDVRERVIVRQGNGGCQTPIVAPPPREAAIRGRSTSPGAMRAAHLGRGKFSDGDGSEREGPRSTVDSRSEVIRGRDPSPGRVRPGTREQLLVNLRLNGGQSQRGWGAPSLAAADIERVAALAAPTPSSRGCQPAELRPAEERRRELPAATTLQPRDRAELLRRLSGGSP